MEFLIVLVILLAVVFVVTAPLRRTPARTAADGSAAPSGGYTDPELLELEAAQEAKYREIRDAELDHQTGKLSDADFEAVDRALRAEAIAILRKLDAAQGKTKASQPTDGD